MRRAALLVLLAMPACTRADLAAEVRAVVAGVRPPVAYSYTVEQDATRTQVDVRIADSFRYTQHVTIDDVPALDRIVVDDALAVRPLEPGRDLLATGVWVTDPYGAPPLHTSGPYDDALRVAAYVRDALTPGVARYSAGSLTASRVDDPFPPPRDGETRYDVLVPPLPARGSGELPVTAHFRRMAIYVKGSALLRVLERISIDDHPDVARARRRGTNADLLELVETIRAGRGPEPVDERTMRWEITSRDVPDVTLPTDG